MTSPLDLPVSLAPLAAQSWYRNTFRAPDFRSVPHASARDAKVLQVFAIGTRPRPPAGARAADEANALIQADLDYLFVTSVAADNRPPARYRVLTQGDWYGAASVETSVRETLTARLLSLSELPPNPSGAPRSIQPRLVYRATVTGPAFVDLTVVRPRPRWLRSLQSYQEHRLYAARARAAGAQGIHYPSARHTNGRCVICYERAAIAPSTEPIEEMSVSLSARGHFEVTVGGSVIHSGNAATWLRQHPAIS